MVVGAARAKSRRSENMRNGTTLQYGDLRDIPEKANMSALCAQGLWPVRSLYMSTVHATSGDLPNRPAKPHPGAREYPEHQPSQEGRHHQSQISGPRNQTRPFMTNDGKGVSEFVTVAQTRKCIEASAFAALREWPFTHFVTIHLEKGCVDIRPQDFVTQFLKHFADWMRPGGPNPPAYVWVFENSRENGLHVHIAMHVPSSRRSAFPSAARGWLVPCGARWTKGLMNIIRIGAKIRAGSPNGTWKAQCGTLKYMLKGTDPRACGNFGIRHQPQGRVSGKRCGVSEALNSAARKPLATVWSDNWEDELYFRPNRR